ncbi:MAG: hypothetical protein AB1730_28545 [Myxococcota bacterium]
MTGGPSLGAGEVSSSFTAVMHDGGLVESCPGPACDDGVAGVGDGVALVRGRANDEVSVVPLGC